MFVTVEAYVDAGGAVIRDLFDAEDAGYLADAALVQRLALAKLEEACAAVRAEGWKWVKAELSRDYGIGYGRVVPQRREADGDDEADAARFAPADLARAGALVSLDHDGSLRIERGLVHPDDREAPAKAPRAAGAPGDLSAALVTDLSAHRTAALRIELARNPAVALAATVHALALPLLYDAREGSCLALKASSERLGYHTRAAGDCPAHGELEDAHETWRTRLPAAPDGLFAWCLAQDQAMLLDLLACVAGLTVNAVVPLQAAHADAADDLARAVGLDMAPWWQPSAEGFWQRLSKAAMIHAMGEAGVTAAAPLGGVKKAEAAAMVAKAMTGSGWLPVVLRTPTPDIAATDTTVAA